MKNSLLPLPLFLLLLFLFIITSTALAQDFSKKEVSTSYYSGPIIDMHLHGYTSENFLGPIPNPATGKIEVKTAEEHRLASIEMMKKHNIVLAMVSGASLQASEAWIAERPDAVLKGVSFEDPKKGLSAAAFSELVKKKKVDVLGEIGAQYAGYSPSDSIFDPYWTIAEENNIPIGIHTGASFPGIVYKGAPRFRLKQGDPFLMEDMLALHPKLNVYIMHAGGPFYQNAITLMVYYPQVYADIGALTWIPTTGQILEKFLKEAKEQGVLDRVMYGTDQMLWPEAIEMSVNRLNSLGFLSLEEKKAIFYDNAARFLGLSAEEIARHHREEKVESTK